MQAAEGWHAPVTVRTDVAGDRIPSSSAGWAEWTRPSALRARAGHV